MRKTKTYTLTNALIQRYADYLQEQERAGRRSSTRASAARFF